MKKINKSLLALGVASLAMLLSLSPIELFPAHAALPFEGELNSGAKVTYSSSADTVNYLQINMSDTINTGSNFYVRLKNYTSNVLSLHVTLESVNGHGSVIRASGSYNLFDSFHNNVPSLKTTDNSISIPASFDGFFSINNLNLTDDPNWTQGDTVKDIKNIKALYLGINSQSASVTIGVGDVFTAGNYNVDVSEILDIDFSNSFLSKPGSTGLSISRLPATDFDTNHDVEGGVMVSLMQAEDDNSAYWLVFPEEQNLSGSGIYLRMKNAWAYGYYIQFYLLSTNNHRNKLAPSAALYTYDTQGKNKTVSNSREFGSYFFLAGSFDGYLFIPFAALENDPSWAGNTTSPDMDYASIYALVFGASTKHDYAGQAIFGDMFADNATIYDGSEYSNESLSSHIIPDQYGNGQYVNISRLPGYVGETIADYSLSSGYSAASIEGGAIFTVLPTESDITSSLRITSALDFSSAQAIAIKIKNYSYDYPFYMEVKDNAGKTSHLEGAALGNIYYLNQNGAVVTSSWGGNPTYVKIPVGFDGLMIIPLSSIGGGYSLNLSHITSLEFYIATKYDFGFNVAFGDVGYLDSSLAFHTLVDASALSLDGFASTFVLGNNSNNGKINRIAEIKKSPWIGDVKILNSMIYSDDEAMNKEIVTDVADNPLTYSRGANGITVIPSTYEVGHANGPYSSLALINNGNYGDRTTMVADDGREAKGLTLYVKNLSTREIGVSLGFDQNLENGAQRWTLIGYPSMYYAYDTVLDTDYMFYFKRDQFQIIPGFEGYIRLPFSSFGIPDWCHTNEEMDLSKFSGSLYLAQDNRTYAGLSYLVKNVGVYFNQTTSGSLFSSSHTIKANMGL